MKFYTLLFVFCCLTLGELSAQQLKIQIIDTKDNPIPNATCYIQELALGIMSDENGSFQTKLKSGNYTCEFSSLGYEKSTKTISVPDNGLELKITLKEKTYALREVTIEPGKEDPAYRIMRKVIAHAPYHKNQVKNYESNVYIKGTFKIEKLPALLRTQIKKEERDAVIGKLYLLESQNEVKYTEPNKYEQRVLASKNSIPAELEIDDRIPLSIITNDIYDPETFSGLLAPGSFSVYKFKLDDVYSEGNHTINKIRIIPKKNNGNLVSGWLYIVEDTWTVQEADLFASKMGMNVHFHFSYNEIKDNIFLPTAYDISMKMDALGVKGGAQYYASLRYNKLETNILPTEIEISAEKPVEEKASDNPVKNLSKKQQKNMRKLEELANKEKLSTREAYKMAELMEKAVESDKIKEQKKSLEITPIDSFFTVTHDSLAKIRDSAYWENIRVLPLKNEEFQSYIRRDSVKVVLDSLDRTDSLKNRTAGKWFSHLLMGENIKIDSGNFYFKYGGLLFVCPEYNFVDGFWLGQRFEFGTKKISIKPSAYYATARRKVNWKVNANFRYATMRHGLLSLSAGNKTVDYAGPFGTLRLGNALASLLFAQNTAMFYQKRYYGISNQIDIANGLVLNTSAEYARRNSLENNQSFSFFGGRPHSNLPHGQTTQMPENDALTANVALTWTPRQHYRIYKGEKYYDYSDFPTMYISYSKGINAGISDVDFDRIDFSVMQFVKLGLFNRLYYGINVGAFLSSKSTYFPDYRHFHTSELFVTSKSLNNVFSLIDNYTHSTNDKWMQAHITYSSNYLFLKNLPFLQSYLFDEALHLHTLWLPGTNHSEIGYSLGFGNIGRLGAFLGFDNGKYSGFGISASMPIFSIFSE